MISRIILAQITQRLQHEKKGKRHFFRVHVHHFSLHFMLFFFSVHQTWKKSNTVILNIFASSYSLRGARLNGKRFYCTAVCGEWQQLWQHSVRGQERDRLRGSPGWLPQTAAFLIDKVTQRWDKPVAFLRPRHVSGSISDQILIHSKIFSKIKYLFFTQPCAALIINAEYNLNFAPFSWCANLTLSVSQQRSLCDV